MQTKKLNLNDLKVESFVTSLDDTDTHTLKGGSTAPCSVFLLAYSDVVIAGAAIVVASAVTIINDKRNKSKNGDAAAANIQAS